MRTSNTASVADKLVDLSRMETLNTKAVTFAIENWTNPDFPRRLEIKVRRWMKNNAANFRDQDLIVEYAKIDEASAQWLVNPSILVQNALLKLNDEDDIAIMVRRVQNFTEISPRLWKILAANFDSLSKRTVKILLNEHEAPRVFTNVANPDNDGDDGEAEKPVRRTRKAAEEPQRRTRKVKPVNTTRRSKKDESPVDDDDDYNFDDDDDGDDDEPKKTARRPRTSSKAKPAKVVKTAIQKVREVVKPAKRITVKSKDNMDTRKVKSAVRNVRRPR